VPDEETGIAGELVRGLGNYLHDELVGDDFAAGCQSFIEGVGLVRLGDDAASVRGVILWCIAVPLIALVALKLIDPPWLKDVPDWLEWAIVIAAVVAAVLAILDSLGQGTVTQWLAPVERRIAARIEAKELRKVLLDREPTVGGEKVLSSNG
jgi:hypothetical protein